jgi:uncharacterized membrane protein YciS (DUF1049 family)
MITRELRFKIKDEQNAKITALLESLAVSLFSVITAALLPQLIIQYLVRDGEYPTSQPMALLYLPHFCYALVLFAFAVAVIGNVARSRRIRQYKQELELLALTGEDCDCDDHHHGEEEIAALEFDSMEEVVMEPTKTARPMKKSAAVKKTTKRSKK